VVTANLVKRSVVLCIAGRSAVSVSQTSKRKSGGEEKERWLKREGGGSYRVDLCMAADATAHRCGTRKYVARKIKPGRSPLAVSKIVISACDVFRPMSRRFCVCLSVNLLQDESIH
jgi:hypothetical protein